MVEEIAQQSLIFFPVIGLGIILGLYELILIHRDESFRGSHWLGHGLHSVLFMMIALFAVFNTDYFLQVTGISSLDWSSWLISPWTIRILVGIILNIKMHATSAVIKGRAFSGGISGNLAEHWTHTLLVSAFVVTAPLYWPILQPFLPWWAGGTTPEPATP
ncbi:hypothetical protein HZB00_02335 [Candidatus Woesearchaeota archaeon]|nr:hypothetical protein [Candidatus Woesearchaeota archaeon]